MSVFRHHLLISSLNVRFIWLKSTSAIVNLCDMLTRPALKRKENKPQLLRQRISRKLVDNLPFLNMEGMPELSYQEAITILDKFHALCDKLGPKNLAQKWQDLIKVAIPPPPPITVKSQGLNINVYFNTNNNISDQDFLQCCVRLSTFSNSYEYGSPSVQGGATNKVYICTSSAMSNASPPQPPPNKRIVGRQGRRRGARGGGAARERRCKENSPPPASAAGNSSVSQKFEHGLAAFQQAEGKLAFYFPGCQLSQLILEQNKDEKLQNLCKQHPKDYKKIRGVICKVLMYKGVTYLPVAWPQQLATLLLKKAHVINGVLHLRRHRLEQHLKPFFFIRNFNQMFEAMHCDFCLQNIKHKQSQLPLGLSFKVSQTRSFLSIDVCVVNSKIEYGSFLNIVDICSYFCIAVKCRAAPTAEEVHEIIWTHYCPFGGVPIALQFDNGINASLGHEIAQHFNCREFFITPLNSKASPVEHVHSLLLHVCRGANAMGYITGDSFQLWLSLASLLHNSTKNINGVAPSQLMFMGPPSRTHQFIGLSDLQHQQTKSYFVEKMREASQYLSMIALKRKELNLKKLKKWEQHREKIHCGDLVLKLRTEVKKVLWKLRPRYKNQVYRVVATRRTYCILLPLSSLLSYIQSPFHKGGKPVQRYERADRRFLKLISDPYEHLGLNRAKKYIEAAAEILGQHEPVKRITLGPPNKVSKTNHPFYRIFANPHPASTFGPPSSHPQKEEGVPQQSELCFTENPSFLQKLRSNRTRVDNFVNRIRSDGKVTVSEPFVTLEGNSHYVMLKSGLSWQRSEMEPAVSNPTVPYGYTAIYKRDRLKRMKQRKDYLQDLVSHPSGGGGGSQGEAPHPAPPDLVSDDPLHMLSDKQLAKVSKYFLHIEKRKIFPLIMSELEKIMTKCEDFKSATSSSSPSPVRQPSPPPGPPSRGGSRSRSSSSRGSSSQTFHSDISGSFRASDDGGEGEEDQVGREEVLENAQVPDLTLAPAPAPANRDVDDQVRLGAKPKTRVESKVALSTGGSDYQRIQDVRKKKTVTRRSGRSSPPASSLSRSTRSPASQTPLLSRTHPFSPRISTPPSHNRDASPALSLTPALPPQPSLSLQDTKNKKTRISLRLQSRADKN